MTRCENPSCKRYIGIGETIHYADHWHVCSDCYERLQRIGSLAEKKEHTRLWFWITIGIITIISVYLAWTG